jgi:hypothetical protein
MSSHGRDVPVRHLWAARATESSTSEERMEAKVTVVKDMTIAGKHSVG